MHNRTFSKEYARQLNEKIEKELMTESLGDNKFLQSGGLYI